MNEECRQSPDTVSVLTKLSLSASRLFEGVADGDRGGAPQAVREASGERVAGAACRAAAEHFVVGRFTLSALATWGPGQAGV